MQKRLAQKFSELMISGAAERTSPPEIPVLSHGCEPVKIGGASGPGQASLPYLEDIAMCALGSTPGAATKRAMQALDNVKQSYARRNLKMHNHIFILVPQHSRVHRLVCARIRLDLMLE